jgi:hypothetical protein
MFGNSHEIFDQKLASQGVYSVRRDIEELTQNSLIERQRQLEGSWKVDSVSRYDEVMIEAAKRKSRVDELPPAAGIGQRVTRLDKEPVLSDAELEQLKRQGKH